MADRTLTVRILGDSGSLIREFSRSGAAAKRFNRDLDRSFRGAIAGSGAFRTLGRSVAFASTSFLGAAGLAASVRGAFSELAESNRVTAQTNAALTSTGRVAGVTAKHIEDLGNTLLRKTGIDDEAIRSAENLLLTFTNVRNSVGSGNDVFDQATKAVLDMSIAMDGDLKGATVRVGKALQDPVKGVTALRRVGVLFTDSQEKQLKTLVKTGRSLEAQQIILKELTREFGGSAAAAGNVQPWNLLRETIRNVSAEIARGFLPQIQEIVGRLQAWFDNTENVARLQARLSTAVDLVSGAVRTARSIIQRLVDTLGGWKTAMTVLVGAFAGFKAAGIASAIAVQSANIVAAGVTASAWKAALISTGWGAFAIAAGVAATLVITHWTRVKNALERIWIAIKFGGLEVAAAIAEAFSHLPGDLGRSAGRARDAILQQMDGLREDFARLGLDAGNAYVDAFTAAVDRLPGKPTKLGPGPGMTLRIPKTAGPEGPVDDRAPRFSVAASDRALKASQDRLLKQLAVGKKNLATQKQIVKVTAEQREEARRLARNARQFRALGLTDTGEERVPGVKALRAKRAGLAEAIQGTFLNTGKTRSVLSNIRKVLSGGLGAVGRDVRAKIAELLGDIDRQLKEHAGSRTKFRVADTDKILAGLGLSPEQMRAARGRLAQLGPGGTVPQRGGGAFGIGFPIGGGVTITGPVTVKADNPDAFMRELQKRAQRAPAQRGGRTPGVGMGLG